MNRKLLVLVACVVVGSMVQMQPIEACSAFGLKGDEVRLMAVDYDWEVPGGRLIVNPRAVEKTALVSPEATPAYWVSKFGSVTFNQYGRDFPIGGLNEIGLAIQALWLDGTEYPPDVRGPSISALQWVQYCLDNFLTIHEVVDSASRFQISSPAELHFLACDRSGACAVVEFLEGRPAIRAGEELPLPVLTNSTYADSIKALDASLGYGGAVKPAEGAESLDRFVRTATERNRLMLAGGDQAEDQAFRLLGEVAIEDLNQWRIVYDLKHNVVTFTTRGNSKRRWVDLDEVDLHCYEGGVRSIELAAAGAGDVASKLEPFTTAQNTDLVRFSISKTGFLKDFSEERINALATYPDSLTCTLGPRRPTPTPLPGQSRPVRE